MSTAEEGGVPPTLMLDTGSGEVKRPTVLVHCQKGRSRSATIVMAYLIKANGWTVAEALEYYTKRRPSVEPNIGFLTALGDWQAAMDTDERTEKRSRQCLSLRNAQSTPAAVSQFFERHVGLVMDVTSYQSENCGVIAGSGGAAEGMSGRCLSKPMEAQDEGSESAMQEAPRSDDAPSSPRESTAALTCGRQSLRRISVRQGINQKSAPLSGLLGACRGGVCGRSICQDCQHVGLLWKKRQRSLWLARPRMGYCISASASTGAFVLVFSLLGECVHSSPAVEGSTNSSQD